MSATQAPPSRAGSGRIVREQSTQQVNAVDQLAGAPRTTSTRSRRTRRTNLLSALTPVERKAFLQEQLDQAAIFRQIACAKNGVPGPVERNVIGDAPTTEEYEQEALESGIPEADVRRREELARREAMIEVREEVLRRMEQELQNPPTAQQPDEPEPAHPDTPTVHVTTPPVGVPTDEARLREDLARREAELNAREEDMRRRQEDARRAQEERAAEQRLEDERRQQADRDRQDAYQQRLNEIEAEAARRRAEEDERLRQAQEAQAARDRQAEEAHQQRMNELERERQALEAQRRRDQEDAERRRQAEEDRRRNDQSVNVNVDNGQGNQQPSAKPPFWTAAKAAATGVGGTAALAALAAWMLWPDGSKPVDPPVTDNTPVVSQPADPNDGKPVVGNDAQTLLLLQSSGLAAPKTPLGEKVLEAFEKDPSLRERVMKEVESTLLQEPVTPQPFRRATGNE